MGPEPVLGGGQRVDLFGGGQFVGLGNYVRLASDPNFAQAIWLRRFNSAVKLN